MEKKIFVVLSLLASVCVFGQGADSLLQKAIDEIPNNLEVSQELFNSSLKLTTTNDEKLSAYDTYCTELLYASETKLLYTMTNEALKLALSKENYGDYARIIKHKYDVFNLQKDYDSALTTLNRYESLAFQYNDTTNIVTAYTERGGFFELAGDLPRALDFQLKALELSEMAMDTFAIATSYINLAVFYQKIDNSDLALSYNKKALNTYLQLGENIKLAQIYSNIGLSYDDLGQLNNDPIMHDSAGYYFEKGYAIAENLGSQFGMAVTKLNMGLNAYRKKEYQVAISIFDDVFVFFDKVSDDLGVCLCYLNYCRIYKDLGQVERAIELGIKGFELAKKNKFTNEMQQTSKSLFQLYEMKNDAELAYQYFKEFTAAKDTIFNRNNDREIGALESKFELNKSMLENTLLEKEVDLKSQTITSQRTLIGAAVLTVALLLIIALLLRKQLLERKRLSNTIEEQSNKLKELDKAKTRFFANISHDLRSPLTLILGSLDKISERDYDILDAESREMLDLGYKNGKRLLYLADEIMDLTRLEEGKVQLNLQYVKIVPYLRLLTKMFSSAADIKMIELKFSTEADEETILHLDPHQFEKIIYNLLSNAIKFTPDGGKVDIELKTEKEYLKIMITDSGSGIPTESIQHIFDRYYQAGSTEFRSQTGVGIGLALVKELVELHEGLIQVESSSSGTIFTISIPFKESDWISQAIIPERSLDVVTKNSLWIDLQDEKERLQVSTLTNVDENAPAILIVEDHKELRSYLKSILSTHYRIYLAANGTAALDLLQSEKIELIITDLMMPYMDGFELIDHLKKDKELKKIPVLVVSARTDKSEKLELLSKGAAEVISKPFDKEELIIRIKNALGTDWDSNKKLTTLYSENAEEFEKSIMSRLERLIIKRVADPHLSVLDLADEMAASERKVYRLIKKISGLTPYELIKEIRWQYLEQYLRDNKIRTATEAAQLIGMSNVSSFSGQYEKRFGHSVREMMEN
ncbi:MAG: ATP-binding protein [Cyclobacteriaceae bacterium]